jgi:DNA (cytosine-5)-methyltransferase 1
VTIRGVDLFCGGGGSSWGARRAGIEMVGAVDAWDIAAQTYQDNFPDAKVLNTRLDADTGARIFGTIGRVDVLLGSPECTNHSIARGSRPRDEESRRSGTYVLRFLRELKPRWVVLENVHLMRNWDGYADLLADLDGLGYNIRQQVLDAASFGVPQTRRRLFIIGDRHVKPPRIEPPGTAPLSVGDILDPAGTWPCRPLFIPRRAPATLERVKRGMSALGEGVDFLVVYYSSDRAGGWQPLNRPLRTMTTLDRFGLVQWIDGEPTFRMLQVPELQRAMGLPRAFRLRHGTRRDKVRILGNGVCAPVMQHVLAALIKTTSTVNERGIDRSAAPIEGRLPPTSTHVACANGARLIRSRRVAL